MDEKICTIDLTSGVLDNEYTFYEDGRIKHFFDQSIYKPNVEHWLTAKDLSDSQKEMILANCPAEFKERISALLYT